MNEFVKLTVPHERPYHHVVHLVMGGLAARLNLSLEHLEDVQLALDGLLGNESYAVGKDVSIEVSIAEGLVEVSVGPLDPGKLEPDLAAAGESDENLGLNRVLTTLVGGFEVERRDGGGWVRFRKEVPGGRAAART